MSCAAMWLASSRTLRKQCVGHAWRPCLHDRVCDETEDLSPPGNGSRHLGLKDIVTDSWREFLDRPSRPGCRYATDLKRAFQLAPQPPAAPLPSLDTFRTFAA